MIVIDKIEYESYLDVCKAFDISYAEFINYRRANKGISELDLLGHFFKDIAVSLETGEYMTYLNKERLGSGEKEKE